MSSIRVKLFATLLRYRPDLRHGQEFELAVPQDADLRLLLADLNVPEEAVRHVFVNGKRAALEYRPHDGDEVAIFPPIAGLISTQYPLPSLETKTDSR